MTYQLALLPRNAPLRGRVTPPGSKSITNRALLLAALADGNSHLTGALKSDDTGHMAKALQAMGVHVEEPAETRFLVIGNGRLIAPAEPLFLGNAGTATHFLFPNLPPVIDGSQMQDAVPTLAVLAAFDPAPVRFVGIANLRVKECDRITAMATGLSGLCPGLAVENGDDLLGTPGGQDSFRPAWIETYSDHRIAMSLAFAELHVPGVTILDPDCVNKTYPDYWRDTASLGVAMETVTE